MPLTICLCARAHAEFAEMPISTRVSKLHTMLSMHNHLNELERQAVAIGASLGFRPVAATGPDQLPVFT
jgi:hypothetical protein